MGILRFDFEEDADGWTGQPLVGINTCATYNSLRYGGSVCGEVGYFQHSQPGTCQSMSKYYEEITLWRAFFSGLRWTQARVGIQVSHAYIPPGGQNSILKAYSDTDLISPFTTEDTYTFSITVDDTSLDCQEVALTPAAAVTNPFIIIYLGIWGGTVGVATTPVVQIRYLEFDVEGGQFYEGVDSVSLVGDSPVQIVTPDAMVVSPADITLLGSADPLEQMILASSDGLAWAEPAEAAGNTKTDQITSLRIRQPCSTNVGEPTGGITLPTNTGQSIELPPGQVGQVPGSQGPGLPPAWVTIGERETDVVQGRTFS